MQPYLDYVYGERVDQDTGVVSDSSLTDTAQRYKVLAVGPGRYEFGVLVVPAVEVGDIVLTQKHADADTPEELHARGLGLFMANRIVAIESRGSDV